VWFSEYLPVLLSGFLIMPVMRLSIIKTDVVDLGMQTQWLVFVGNRRLPVAFKVLFLKNN